MFDSDEMLIMKILAYFWIFVFLSVLKCSLACNTRQNENYDSIALKEEELSPPWWQFWSRGRSRVDKNEDETISGQDKRWYHRFFGWSSSAGESQAK